MPEVFPFTLYHHEYPTWVESPREFKALFLAFLPKCLKPWYAYSVVILSPSDVTFKVYDMRSFTSGGVGKLKGDFMVNAVDYKITRPAIERRARQLATIQRQEALETVENAEIDCLTRAILLTVP